MTRRTTYKVVEGTKQNPKKILVRVGAHNERYGRASLPMSVIGKIVEVIVPDVPIADDALGNGESPEPIMNRKKKAEESENKVEESVPAESPSGSDQLI